MGRRRPYSTVRRRKKRRRGGGGRRRTRRSYPHRGQGILKDAARWLEGLFG